MSDRAAKPRRHRLEVRVTPEQDGLIRQAADFKDTTVTAFVLDTVTSRAKRVAKHHHDVVMSNQAFDRFIAKLDKASQAGARAGRPVRGQPKASRGVSRAPRDLLELLDAHHDVSTFDSGNEALDEWLRRHALEAQRMDSVRKFVVRRSGRVVGYFSLTMGSVLRAVAPTKLVRGMPAYPVGMVLQSRLGSDQSEQGKGFGATLLAEALRKAVVAEEVAAARLRRMKDIRASLDSSADG